MCVSCRAPVMQGVRGSETSLEKEAEFCAMCYPDQQMSVYLFCTYLKKKRKILSRKQLCFLCFPFPMFESMEGQLKVDAVKFDLRVAGGCVDVAERDCCRQMLTVTFG